MRKTRDSKKKSRVAQNWRLGQSLPTNELDRQKEKHTNATYLANDRRSISEENCSSRSVLKQKAVIF